MDFGNYAVDKSAAAYNVTLIHGVNNCRYFLTTPNTPSAHGLRMDLSPFVECIQLPRDRVSVVATSVL